MSVRVELAHARQGTRSNVIFEWSVSVACVQLVANVLTFFHLPCFYMVRPSLFSLYFRLVVAARASQDCGHVTIARLDHVLEAAECRTMQSLRVLWQDTESLKLVLCVSVSLPLPPSRSRTFDSMYSLQWTRLHWGFGKRTALCLSCTTISVASSPRVCIARPFPSIILSLVLCTRMILIPPCLEGRTW